MSTTGLKAGGACLEAAAEGLVVCRLPPPPPDTPNLGKEGQG